MTFALARVGAVVAMRVEDYYPQSKRWWVRLHEKGGKRHEMPAHHTLEAYLDAYIDAAGIRDSCAAMAWAFSSVPPAPSHRRNRALEHGLSRPCCPASPCARDRYSGCSPRPRRTSRVGAHRSDR
jgi:hypothetical protein